ncbi:MAG TPA: hypothetical protein VFA94_04150 [Acidimicrobiales bacterium]|nr:hypothetical protein [Acidimicrobiales bacterium]
MEPVNLRPLGIGEALDVAIKVYRARFRTLVRTVVVVVAPVQLVAALIQLSLPASDAFRVSSDTGTTTVDVPAAIGYGAALVIVGLLSYVATQLATAASLNVVSSAYLGEDVDWKPSLKFATQRLRSLIWVSFLATFISAIALIACIVPGVYLFFAWSVAVPVLLLEDRRGWAALQRSQELVKGRWWHVAACVILGLILASVVRAAFQGILLGLVQVQGNDVVTAVASFVTSTASAALVTPFTAAVITIVYFDLRVRKEGFDLELLAHSLGTEVPTGPVPDFLPPLLPDFGEDKPPFWPPPPGWQPRQ